MIFLVTLFLILSCNSNTSENEKETPANVDKLNVLVVTHLENDLEEMINFPSYMPNFNIIIHDGTGTLTKVQLDSQDVVLYFTNGAINTESIGNALYDYVLDGGNLLIGSFFGFEDIDDNFGKLTDIMPAKTTDPYSYEAHDTLYVKNQTTILKGVDTLRLFYAGGNFVLDSSATVLAKWNNGEMLAAYNEPNGRVMLLSSFPSEPAYFPSLKNNAKMLNNFYRLWANAIRFTHSKTTLDSDLNF
jgi:hypothetical protein